MRKKDLDTIEVETSKSVEVETPEGEKVNQPAGAPIAGLSSRPIDRETLSHQWQENSAAVDTNVLHDHGAFGSDVNGSILDKIDSPENLEKKEKAAEAAAESLEQMFGYQTDDCSKLDVSDPRYCQPGSERHKAFLERKK